MTLIVSILKKLTYLLDVLFVCLIVILPVHTYDWMREINPEITQLPEDSLQDIRLIITFSFLLIIILLHVIQIIKYSHKSQYIIHGLLIVSLSVLWIWKFLI